VQGAAGGNEWGITVNRVLIGVVSVLALTFALAPKSARAYFDPPWITPTLPTASDVVSVNIRGGICDSIFFRQGFPQITQQGHSIRILEYGHHWDDLDLCVYNVGTLVQPIGTFAPGDYTLTVDFTYEDYPFGYATTTLGVVPFTVAGVTPATPVPTLTQFGQLALLTSIGVVVLRDSYIRRRTARQRPGVGELRMRR
jgi:hypothetical protein